MCKPRLPVMMRLIENIMRWLHDLSIKQGKPISDLYLDFNEVLTGTGPSAFTAAILAEMTKSVGTSVRWDKFSGLTEAKLVGGVLVLPVEAFAAGTGHSDSGNHKGKGAMVKHHFHASSWPSKHPRFKHPVYGEVEKCNWDLECVKLWDANTAFFDGLPEEERLKIIKIKEKKYFEPLSPPTINEKVSDGPDLPMGDHAQKQSLLRMQAEDEASEKSPEGPLMHQSNTAEDAIPLPLVLESDTSESQREDKQDSQLGKLPSDDSNTPAVIEEAEGRYLEIRDTQDEDNNLLAITEGLTPGLDLSPH
jgi:hypothetical protein